MRLRAGRPRGPWTLPGTAVRPVLVLWVQGHTDTTQERPQIIAFPKRQARAMRQIIRAAPVVPGPQAPVVVSLDYRGYWRLVSVNEC
jgi:hypothetical protein